MKSAAIAFLNSTYSQKQESESDAYGYEFLNKKGRNPWSMALAFKKMKELEEKEGVKKDSKLNRMLSTHPALDKRIQKMTERAEKKGIAKPANK